MIENWNAGLEIKPLEGYDPAVGRLLWQLAATRGRTLETLDGLDDGALDWRPSGGGNAVGAMLYHIAAIEIDWLFADALQRPFPPAVTGLLPWGVRDETGSLTAVTGQSLADHLERLAATRQILLDGYREIDPADFRRVRDVPGASYRVTPEWVLHHLIQHEAEHRGQIGDARRRWEAAAGKQDGRPGDR